MQGLQDEPGLKVPLDYSLLATDPAPVLSQLSFGKEAAGKILFFANEEEVDVDEHGGRRNDRVIVTDHQCQEGHHGCIRYLLRIFRVFAIFRSLRRFYLLLLHSSPGTVARNLQSEDYSMIRWF